MAAAPQALLNSPPPPPEVTAQQNPGQVSQFVNGYQPGAGQQQNNAPKELIKQKMQQVAQQLSDIARVLATTDPASMPILKRMVEAGSMLMRTLEQNQQEASQGNPDVPRQAAEPVGPQGAQGASMPGQG